MPADPERLRMQSPDDEFRQYVADSSPARLRTAYLLVGGDWAHAEDLLQSALTKAYLSWNRISDHGAVEAGHVVVVRCVVSTAACRTAASFEGKTVAMPAPVIPR